MAAQSKLKKAEQDFLDSLRDSLDDAEKLLREAADASGEKATQLREQAMRSLSRTRDGLSETHDALYAHGKEAACAANEYIHERPWQAIGAAGLAGLVIGMLISRQ
ncbi:MAG TPA: DUF883 family protein [Burkholderiaceae bacterium]|nr:DUF883 family protein [Burkholderiaceae bacterium]